MKTLLLSFLLAFSLLSNSFAQIDPKFRTDSPGTKDHQKTKRIDGSIILRQSSKKFAQLTIPQERVVFDYASQAFAPFRSLRPEGALTTSFYRLPKDATTLECIRAYQSELEQQGFETLFEGSSGGSPTGSSNSLDNGFGRFLTQVYQTEKDYSIQQYTLPGCDDYRYLAMKKSSPEGTLFITLFCGAVTSGWRAPEMGIETNTVLARLDVLEEKNRDDRMVLVKAPEMENLISSTGRVALYGIYFDFNKDSLKPESDATLEQIAALLKNEPNWKIVVVGHTDNIGDFEFNRDLSARRARSVVTTLTNKYGIDKNRLFPFGCSFACPAAPNSSEEGRAKNRRVELVRWN